ncbi:MAG: extracellular solute-binding protein [Spirochaetales bacterium]|jgi:spermidine/putrescine transport system substrate-binding protein|nr:extracellular solute-binding protein [Spirochaetales bacterium]
MKKIPVLALVIASALTGGIWAGGKSEAPAASKVLYFYNWVTYIPEDVRQTFEEETGIEVILDEFATNEEMYAKLKAGGSGYDVTIPSGDFVSIMIREGMLEPIDMSKVPNFKYIDPEILSKITFDPGNRYSVPFFAAAAGITVNTKQVPNFEKSWKIFSRSDLKGHMTMLDDMREVMGDALKLLGYSVNTRNQDELQQAKKVVSDWRDRIVKFDAETFGPAFARGEFWVVQGYVENVFTELDESMAKDAQFFIPKEGGPMYLDSMVILKGAKNLENAYRFIDFISRPDINARIADFLTIPSLNMEGRKLMKETPAYSYEDLNRCEFKEDLGRDVELYESIWHEIRIGK